MKSTQIFTAQNKYSLHNAHQMGDVFYSLYSRQAFVEIWNFPLLTACLEIISFKILPLGPSTVMSK